MDKSTLKKIAVAVAVAVAGLIAVSLVKFLGSTVVFYFKSEIENIASDGYTDMDDVLNGQRIIMDSQKLILEKLGD